MEDKIILFIVIPVLSAFIGWITNYIAIKSLFRPVKPFKIFFFSFQGLIPKRKKALIGNMADVITEHIISEKDIIDEILSDGLNPKIRNKCAKVLEEKILEKIPDMFKIIAKPIVSSVIAKELDNILDAMISELTSDIANIVDFKKIIISKLEMYDVSKIETIINKIAKNELKHIELLGAVIGFIVGLLQSGFILFL